MEKAAVSYYPSYVEEEAIHAIHPEYRIKAITAYVYEKFLENIDKDFAKREGLLFVGGRGSLVRKGDLPADQTEDRRKLLCGWL
jgi:hypothetical protein